MRFNLSPENRKSYIISKKEKFKGIGANLLALWWISLINLFYIPVDQSLLIWIIILSVDIAAGIITWVHYDKKTLYYQNIYNIVLYLGFLIISNLFIFNAMTCITGIDKMFFAYLIISDIIFAVCVLLFILNKISNNEYNQKNNKNLLIKIGTIVGFMAYPASRVLIKILNSNESIVILVFALFICTFYILYKVIKSSILFHFQRKLGFDEDLEIYDKTSSQD